MNYNRDEQFVKICHLFNKISAYTEMLERDEQNSSKFKHLTICCTIRSLKHLNHLRQIPFLNKTSEKKLGGTWKCRKKDIVIKVDHN